MNDDYLWDRSGAPDAEIEDLEKKLARLRYRHRGELAGAGRERPRVWMALAAAVFLAVAAGVQFRTPAAPVTPWQVASLAGASRLGGQDAAVAMTMRAGQVLETAGDAEVSLEASEVGKIDLFPDSELRATNRQMELRRGKLHAFIWARPGRFVVETPSARAVDLGCEYTIEVDPSGNGLLRVSTGWVAFQHQGRESFIPEGAQCVTRKKGGPGLPFYEDALEGLRRGVERYDAGDGSAAVTAILGAARGRDGLTVWHLLTRVAEEDRARVFDRLAELVRLPAEVTREGAVRRDPQTIDRCWDALNLENTDWWRGWERKW